MIRAGDLRNRVQIQAATTTQADSGQVTSTWATIETRWAQVTAVGGGELMQGQQIAAQATHLVRMRYHATLTTRHRILFGTRVLEINAVRDPDGKRVETLADCRESV